MISYNYLYAIIIIAVLLIFLIIISFSLRKKKSFVADSESVNSEFEKQARSALESEVRKSKVLFTTLIITASAGLLSKLWDWWFTPRKVATTGGLLLVAGSTFSYFALTTVYGDFAINVKVPQETFAPLNSAKSKISIEARTSLDSTFENSKSISGIEFYKANDEIPFENGITLETNSDGIAYVKFKGRGLDKNNTYFKFNIRPAIEDTNYYFEGDLFVSLEQLVESLPVVILKKKRAKVSGSFNFAANAKDLMKMLPPGSQPKTTFTIELYPENVDGENAQVGNIWLKKRSGQPDSMDTKFNFKAGSYILDGIDFQDSPFIVRYSVDDSSNFKIKIIPDEPLFGTDNGKNPEIKVGAGGNNAPPIIKPEMIYNEQAANIIYNFHFDGLGTGEKYDLRIVIESNKKGDFEYDNDYRVPIVDNKVKFPKQEIPYPTKFWSDYKVELYLLDKNGNTISKTKNFKLKDVLLTDITIVYEVDKDLRIK